MSEINKLSNQKEQRVDILNKIFQWSILSIMAVAGIGLALIWFFYQP
jgi:hypothetical protein